jgi:hypothetical protein
MRRRLSARRRINLEVGFAEAGHALIVARRIENADVQFERVADPVAKLGMVREIIVGQRMDEGAEA